MIISSLCFPGKQINKEQIQDLAPQDQVKAPRALWAREAVERREQFPARSDEYICMVFIITMPIHLNYNVFIIFPLIFFLKREPYITITRKTNMMLQI